MTSPPELRTKSAVVVEVRTGEGHNYIVCFCSRIRRWVDSVTLMTVYSVHVRYQSLAYVFCLLKTAEVAPPVEISINSATCQA